MKHINLRIAGPSPLPPQVRRALAMQVISHRGSAYQKLHEEIARLTAEFFQTKNDLFLFTASGTGTMEASIVNTLSPGDSVLGVSIGNFGDRFLKVANAYGMNVTELKYPMGEAAKPDEVAEEAVLSYCKAIIITHNETSSAITNSIADIVKAVRKKDIDPLFLVDSVSGMGNLDLPVDELGLDVVFTSSQKCWMSPPGVAMVSISEKAWDAYQTSASPRYYFDFGKMKKSHEKHMTPETPAVSTLFALRAGLRLMKKRGVKETFAYHAKLAQYTRTRLKKEGFKLAGDETHASDTVTAVWVPEGVSDKDFRDRLKKDHAVVLAGGKADWSGKVVRIAHMGWVSKRDISKAVDAMVRVWEVYAKNSDR